MTSKLIQAGHGAACANWTPFEIELGTQGSALESYTWFGPSGSVGAGASRDSRNGLEQSVVMAGQVHFRA